MTHAEGLALCMLRRSRRNPNRATNPAMQPLDLIGADLSGCLALNNAHAVELSHATDGEFRHLVASAWYARGFAPARGFALAFDQDSDITGANFLWFKARLARFVYIDRVVIAPAARGQGLARQLYLDVFEAARRARHTCITCEINIEPPNPASDAFHARLGFRIVGTRHLPDRGKTVQYYQYDLQSAMGSTIGPDGAASDTGQTSER
jgi:uncharacterized protein